MKKIFSILTLTLAIGQYAGAQNIGINANGVVSEKGGTASAQFRYDLTTQVTDIFPSQLSAYPNPVNSILTIEMATITNQSMDVMILNSLGQTIQSKEVARQSENKLAEFDLSDQQPGIYLVRVKGSSTVRDFKIIKQ